MIIFYLILSTVPSSAPEISTLLAPSSTMVSVSWQPAVYINGPLVSYQLTLLAEDSNYTVSINVPVERSSWIFGPLLSGQTYQVEISAVNENGEGPASVRTIETPEPVNCKLLWLLFYFYIFSSMIFLLIPINAHKYLMPI